MAELRRFQAERRAQIEAAVAEAALLAQAAEITGEKADTAEPFAGHNFEFSAIDMARMMDRHLSPRRRQGGSSPLPNNCWQGSL